MCESGCGCGCDGSAACGCCDGVRPLTPVTIDNRPGLPSLAYRAGTHGSFYETMKARLSSITIDAPGADNQTIETFRPLETFTTRDPADPSIALLDGWATVGDVLTFYQERIANEGYLRTATERRSVRELARLVGYELRPGVAASVYLAYTLEDSQVEPVVIDVGSRSQSIPAPGEFPQFFETSQKTTARREWNNLAVRTHRPQQLEPDAPSGGALLADVVWVAGTSLTLRKGDLLLFELGRGAAFIARLVDHIVPDFTANRTAIWLFSFPGTAASVVLLLDFATAVRALPTFSTSGAAQRMVGAAEEIVSELALGQPSDPRTWEARMKDAADVPVPADVQPLLDTFVTGVAGAVPGLGGGRAVNDAELITSLLLPPRQQARNSETLARSLRASFRQGADPNAQLLVNFAPGIRRTYYTALANANVDVGKARGVNTVVTGVFAIRTRAQIFGGGVPKIPTFDATTGRLKSPNLWDEWPVDGSEQPDTAYLDQAYESFTPGGYVVIDTNGSREIRTISTVNSAPRTAYGMSSRSTQLTFTARWWDRFNAQDISQLRTTQLLGGAEKLDLVDEPVDGDISGQTIELQQLYDGLTSGRWIMLSGERTDLIGTSGVRASELHMVSGIDTGVEPGRPGDVLHTTLRLATPTAYSYKRSTLRIFANVIPATHGETRSETLGSGDGAASLQTFTLRQPPLTFTPAPTVSGVNSSLAVYVNDVQWHEQTTLAGAAPIDRIFSTQQDETGATSVIFGTGKEGARLPSGVENIRAVYRTGIGAAGNVQAEQISLVTTAPLGVKSVLNPLRASGGADAEGRDQARANAPLAVMSLDRLVSMQDYEDFTRTFAGVGKARVARLTDGRRQFLHLTIAGADDVPIDPTSDLFRNLLLALRKFGDPELPVTVASRELVGLVLSANVSIDPDFPWDVVSAAIRATLLERFGFAALALAEPARVSSVIAAIQSVTGVVYCDVDTFGGVPEKITAADPATRSFVRRFQTPAEISDAVTALLNGGAGNGVAVQPGDVSADTASVDAFGHVLPAQLAIFSPAVPDTLILNQISQGAA